MRRTHLEEDFIWECFAQVVLALKECHRRKDKAGATCPVLHRDIKPGNIMLDGKGRVKMGDFGLAKQLASQSKFAYTHVGTPFYMSPVRACAEATCWQPSSHAFPHSTGDDERDAVQ